METLPDHQSLDIANLGRSFKHVVNSYKFYWFLAILDHIAVSEDLNIRYDELALRMLSTVWYPLDYYKLSFGTQDSFKLLAKQISAEMSIDNQLNEPPLLTQMEQGLPKQTVTRLKKEINKALMRWVSFRFLSPFFATEIKGLRDHKVNKVIKTLSHEEPYRSQIPYLLEQHNLILHPIWKDYFQQNQSILCGFIQ